MSKNIKNDSSEDNFSQLEQDNELIEQIIHNPLILKGMENFEEEEEEDSSLERDKNSDENLESKFSSKYGLKNFVLSFSIKWGIST